MSLPAIILELEREAEERKDLAAKAHVKKMFSVHCLPVHAGRCSTSPGHVVTPLPEE